MQFKVQSEKITKIKIEKGAWDLEENIKFSNIQGIGVPENRERMCTRNV